MSTIEKAAAKLGQRRKSVLSRVVTEETRVDRASPTIVQGNVGGYLHESDNHCDIELDSLAERGFLTPGDGRSELAHQMRRIKRPLLMNIQKERSVSSEEPPANLIMITSSLPGEGKTFTAVNLAISLAAELDKKTLLVDADVSKGGMTEELGITAKRGLSDLLYEKQYSSEDAVLNSNIERLSLLPAGGHTDLIDELFASDLMGIITHGLAESDPDRVVIFDAPPLLATTEAAVLARHMGQVVVVVEANKTPQDAVSSSIEQLEGCANVSLILNKTSQRESGAYGYGYGYAQNYRRKADTAAEEEISEVIAEESAEESTEKGIEDNSVEPEGSLDSETLK